MALEENTPREAVISLNGVSKVYAIGDEKLTALNNVSLDIYPGEFACIIGRSGSGKSTLLNMMAGLEKPTRGRIRVAGRQIEALSEGELVRFRLKNVGFVFQSFNLFAMHTALDNVAMPLMYKGVPRDIRQKRARKMLEAVGLKSHMRHRPGEMSGGQQQRVGIARAFVSKPRVIFADEPTGNLDSITSKQVLYRMLQISKQMGTTFVMVTHEPELASCADRIITILDGKVQSDVVQDPAAKERNRDALFASLEGNMRIGGDSASGEVHQKTAAELASYAAPAAAAQQPEQPKP